MRTISTGGGSLTLALCVLAGCASAGGAGSGRASDLITRVDFEELNVQNAYEVVSRLQPRWLRGRGRVSIQSTTAGEPVVYVDGIRYGSVETLRQVHADALDEIRWVGAADATTRFGTGHPGGAILVTTRR